jgi:hypothetical protein
MKIHVIYTCSDELGSNRGTNFSKLSGQDNESSDEEVVELNPQAEVKADSISNIHANDPGK